MSDQPTERRSIFAGLLLVLIGVLLLLHNHHPELNIAHIVRLYWPVILIAWGIAKLFDNFSARRAGDTRPPLMSGGEIALLFILFVAISGLWGFERLRSQLASSDSFSWDDMWVKKGEPVSEDVAPVPVKPNSAVSVHTPRGDVTIFADEDKDLRIVATKTVSAVSDSESRRLSSLIHVEVTAVNGGYKVEPAGIASDRSHTRIDLEVHLPKQASITAQTDNGDIAISDIAGSATAISQSGDVAVHDVGSDVTATLQSGDVRISNVKGDVRLHGKGNAVELSDITGSATIDGEFFGPVQVSNVAQTTQYTSERTDLTIQKMHGRLDLDSDSLQISDVTGGVKLKTHDKSIDIENTSGRIDVTNAHADVSISLQKAPGEEINVQNDSGGVDLSLPSQSSFEISASSKSGEVQSEFEADSLKQQSSGENSSLEGKMGNHGPKITLVTTYGTINLRKSDT